MSSRYSLIHFLPNPAMGAQLPVAALVEQDGSLAVAKAEHIPGAECLGGTSTANLLNRILAGLESCRNFNELPASLGPQVRLGPAVRLPNSLSAHEAVSWVARHVLPRAQGTKIRATRMPSHSASGIAFLKQFHVDRLVKRNFRPAHHWEGEQLGSLLPISHWVRGKDLLILMEPVSPIRPDLRGDIAKLHTKLSAYRWHIDSSAEMPTKLLTYVLPGGTKENRQTAQEELGASSHRVFDCDSIPQRTSLIETISEVAASSGLFH